MLSNHHLKSRVAELNYDSSNDSQLKNYKAYDSQLKNYKAVALPIIKHKVM